MNAWESLVATAYAGYMLPGQSDTPNDGTANGRNGAWGGAPAYADAPFGRAFSFDASTYVAVPDFAPSAQFSVFARVKTAAFTESWASILKRWDSSVSAGSIHLGRDNNSNRLSNYIRQSDNTQIGPVLGPDVSVADSQWHAVCATADGTNLFVSVDSTRGTGVAYNGTLKTGSVTNPPRIGDSNHAPGVQGWSGQIAEVLLFSYGLSPAQEAILAAGPQTRRHQPPILL